MARKITIRIEERAGTRAAITDEEYTDLANTLWMVLRSTPFHFSVEPDQRADIAQLNDAWAQYGEDAQWSE